ncbi:MAG: hypothetical protein FWD86_03225, partial [Firmicutes bacterium]|nr:hypothetical protein [Bacillota bacterium]
DKKANQLCGFPSLLRASKHFKKSFKGMERQVAEQNLLDCLADLKGLNGEILKNLNGESFKATNKSRAGELLFWASALVNLSGLDSETELNHYINTTIKQQ